MIYNDRVTLIFEKRPEDELLDKVEKKQSFPIPCMRNAMSNYEMMGLLVSTISTRSNCTYKGSTRVFPKSFIRVGK